VASEAAMTCGNCERHMRPREAGDRGSSESAGIASWYGSRNSRGASLRIVKANFFVLVVWWVADGMVMGLFCNL